MTTTTEPTIFHVIFTEAATDQAYGTGWHRAIRESFPSERAPRFRVEVEMTKQEFLEMTGAADIENHIGYVLEHHDGPGVFGTDAAVYEIDRISDAIMAVDNSLRPINTEELSPEGWQALIDVMKETLDLEWKVQRELVDDSFVERHRGKIMMFMTPETEPFSTTITVFGSAYMPFTMGGSPHRYIKCEVEAEGPYELGLDIQGYVVRTTDGRTFVAEATSGALVGQTLEEVREDMASADPETMRQQIEQGQEQASRASSMSTEGFWKLFKRR